MREGIAKLPRSLQILVYFVLVCSWLFIPTYLLVTALQVGLGMAVISLIFLGYGWLLMAIVLLVAITIEVFKLRHKNLPGQITASGRYILVLTIFYIAGWAGVGYSYISQGIRP